MSKLSRQLRHVWCSTKEHYEIVADAANEIESFEDKVKEFEKKIKNVAEILEAVLNDEVDHRIKRAARDFINYQTRG